MISRKEKRVYFIVTVFFLFVQIACRQLELKGVLEWNLGLVGMYLLLGILGSSVLFGVVWLLRKAYNKYGNKLQWMMGKRVEGKRLTATQVFFVSWAFMLLGWFPVLLAYYPGILAYDAGVQMGQVLGGVYNNHHPILHTLLIEGFVRLGDLFGNRNFGVALYTLTQMLSLSAAFAAGITYLRKREVKTGWLILLTVYFALFPTHRFLVVSMTKDVYFTVFVILFLLIFLHLSDNTHKAGMGWHIAYVISLVMLQLLRNNGKYALLVFVGMLFLWNVAVFKKDKKRYLQLLTETGLSILLSSVILSGLDHATKANQGDKREMLSIPIQQIARCMYYYDDVPGEAGIAQEDKVLIDEFLLNQSYKQYQASLADPVKRNTNTYVVRYKTKEFLQTYLGLFTKYPGEYVNAFLAVNSGYFSILDESHGSIYQNTGVHGVGYLQTKWDEENFKDTGIVKDSKWKGLHDKLEVFADKNKHLQNPFVRILAAPGAYLWSYIYLTIWLCFRKKKHLLLSLAFVAGYYATLVFGPTVQLRYLYPLMCVLPFLWLSFRQSLREDQDQGMQ